MARRISEQDIIEINEVYAACGNIKKTAEVCGRSESTIRKYIKKDYVAAAPIKYNDNIQLNENIHEVAEQLTSMYHLCSLTPEECNALISLWKEIKV